MNSSKDRSGKPSMLFNIVRYYSIAILVLVFWSSSIMAAPPLFIPERLPHITIDPGHGGTDSGAKGPTGLLEKTVSLELARKVTLKLEPQYKVILTRNDDYSVGPRQRAAVANQAKADLFIAIHTGAGFLHGTNGITIYYYGSIKGEGQFTSDINSGDRNNHWDRAQAHHKTANLSLATALEESLRKISGDAGCKIKSAPLVLLEGVNMPAVLIEVGHITHPATEKNFGSAKGLESLAHAIKLGIAQYVEASQAVLHP